MMSDQYLKKKEKKNKKKKQQKIREEESEAEPEQHGEIYSGYVKKKKRKDRAITKNKKNRVLQAP